MRMIDIWFNTTIFASFVAGISTVGFILAMRGWKRTLAAWIHWSDELHNELERVKESKRE